MSAINNAEVNANMKYSQQLSAAMMHVVNTVFGALHDIQECYAVVKMYDNCPQKNILAALQKIVTSTNCVADTKDAVEASVATFNATSNVYARLLPTIERFIAENPALCHAFLERVNTPLLGKNEDKGTNSVSMNGQICPSYGNDTEH